MGLFIGRIATQLMTNTIIRTAVCAIVAELSVLMVKFVHKKIDKHGGVQIEIEKPIDVSTVETN